MPKAPKPTRIPVAFRLPAELKQALDQQARQDQRSTTNLLVKILSDWLRSREAAQLER